MEDATLLQDDQEPAAPAGPVLTPTGYQFDMALGVGSFGEVWAGVHLRTSQRVAVKLLHTGLGQSLLGREVDRLREVTEHPNVVTLLDADLEGPPAYLAMPCLAGSLHGRRDASVAQVVEWLRQAAEGLRYCHAKGILHCDLKPANLLLDHEGQVRLADFGQAWRQGEEARPLGSLGYMAPEQIAWALKGAGSPDARWDLYSLGAVGYSLLTGQLPRLSQGNLQSLTSTKAGERLAQYAQLLESEKLVPIRKLNKGVDRDLEAILHTCLELEPEKRMRSAAALVDELDRRASKRPVQSRRQGSFWSLGSSCWLYYAKRWVQRNRLLVGLATLTLLAGLGGLSYVTNPRLPVARGGDLPATVPYAPEERLQPVYEQAAMLYDGSAAVNSYWFIPMYAFQVPPVLLEELLPRLARAQEGLRWLRVARTGPLGQLPPPPRNPGSTRDYPGAHALWHLGMWDVCRLVSEGRPAEALARLQDMFFMAHHFATESGRLMQLSHALNLWRLVSGRLLALPDDQLRAFSATLKELRSPGTPPVVIDPGPARPTSWIMVGEVFDYGHGRARRQAQLAWQEAIDKHDFARLYQDTVGLGPTEVRVPSLLFHPFRELVRQSLAGPDAYVRAITVVYWEMRLETLRVELAMELYRRRHGRPPETLEQLVPEFIEAVPEDRFQGGKLKLKPGFNGIASMLPDHGQAQLLQDPYFSLQMTELPVDTNVVHLYSPPRQGRSILH